MDTETQPVGQALADHTLGFGHGWHGVSREKHHGAQYVRAYNKGVEARNRFDGDGEDVGIKPWKGKRS